MKHATLPTMQDDLTAAQFARQFNVSRETLAQLMSYQALLGKWQKSINLVGPSTLAHFWARHVADSAQILALAPPRAQCWLDLGSGAGFPGLVLAIMLAARGGPRGGPETGGHVHLVESDRKKAGFLRTVIRETHAPASVHHQRIEALSAARPPELAQIDVITARALAPLAQLAPLLAPFFDSSTIALLHKGRDWQEELTQCQQYWTISHHIHPSMTRNDARIVAISALAARA